MGRFLGVLGASVAVALLLPAAGLACGMLAEPIEVTNGASAFAAQTVLIHRRADRVDTHVRMTVAPGARSVSWVLPAPHGATLSLGDEAVFDALEALTAPRITIARDSSGGGCSDAGGGLPDDLDLEVQTGQLGDYTYAIISSGDAEAVATWLGDNGYRVPDGAAEALQPYAEAGLDFIGVKLERPAEDAFDRPTPLIISVEDDSDALPVYPLGLSAVSAGEILPVVVYVIGPGRARVEGVAEATVEDVADQLEDRRSYAYPEAVDALAEAADDTLFVTEAVLEDWGSAATEPLTELAGEGVILTRLFGRVPVAALSDLRLGWHPDGVVLISPVQTRSTATNQGCEAAGSGGGLGALMLLGLLGLRYRRRGGLANRR